MQNPDSVSIYQLVWFHTSMSKSQIKPGSLTVVGLGMQLGRHVSLRTISDIESADRVFVLADSLLLDWVESLNPRVENLGKFYDDEIDRRESYEKMQEAIIAAVANGENVCAALYGHPGVFAQVGRFAMRKARTLGAEATMEPGISAEACLYADLELDPGSWGLISLEATQLMIGERVIDPASLVLLWQVSLAGNVACVGFDAQPERLRVLVEKLERWYPLDHEAILYEAAVLPIQEFRADRIALGALPEAQLTASTTLVIPPLGAPEPDHAVRQQLESLRVL